ncbi:pre-mRNA-splicing factor ATP-dependent RNA helicase DHX16 [Nematocida parisii]|nr:pre-mRNA-splicing factor ATP-dependent RNA helicase DHX16 [Nematocida parisii]KAI5126724.1 pre-mRNA-splicing factor ATP-dependent RNA helicase DHX16 [Nematocida parisii]KAI5140912.1 pre-mRNA-splicing factor ATP-dependent RNA helicase DHX16 [Nematocida parisii]
MTGKKKQKLLEKYLEKKQRQKERDSLVEQLKELQNKSEAVKSDTLTSSSLLVRRKKTSTKNALKSESRDKREKEEGNEEKEGNEENTISSEDNKMSVNDLMNTVSSEALCDGIIWRTLEKRKLVAEEEDGESKKCIKSEEVKNKKCADLIKTDKAQSRTREGQSTLPITHMEDEIVSSVKHNHITIITGGTGTGKSTQVPQFLYENGLCDHKKICITQPRRVSAYAVASRISQEQSTKVGGLCGYRMRYDTKTSQSTKILVLTEGVLLQELADDPFLAEYSVIVLDEVHERSLHQDTALLVLLKLVVKRDLRLVLMSASITDEYISAVQKISGATINKVQVDAQVHHVEIHHMPVMGEYHYMDEMRSRIESLDAEDGSILAFVSTKDETEKMKTLLCMEHKAVFTLHSDTPEDIQHTILSSKGVVIVATNVAETSLTLPDVKYVIDGGREVQKKYSYTTGTYTYNTVLISKESAEQRKGRTGRVSAGVCYRIYTTVEYEKMRINREPEIERERVLPMVSALLKAGVRPNNISRVECITPPPDTAIDTELQLLTRLNIIKESELTPIGRQTLSLPTDPVLSTALLRAKGVSRDTFYCMLNIITAIELYNPRRVHYTPSYIPNSTTYIEALCRPTPQTFTRHKLIQHIIKAFNKIFTSEGDLRYTSQITEVSDVDRRIVSLDHNNTDASVGVSCGKILAWCFSSNLITTYNGKYYYKGEEVRMRSPLPDIHSDKPVPLVCYSIIHPDVSDTKKIFAVCSVIPEY